ncbi:hypothetical protein KC19_2G076900 [Ceratodon purpureus]|uniref:MD-2-related lipid-recognition domain-containing protein n=1 Tax=Ceratodon purpureus TaxID=3225 RepID=A0A8T0IV62_CERPU|nr:hypothetical protein KC19_2G076900 [Ceratodon purpureus]
MAQFVSSRTAVLLLVASLAVLATAAPKPSDWHVCDRHANYDILVKNVTINPDPVVSGEEMTFMVPAYTAKEITGGSVIVSVSFHGVTVHTERNDICEKAACPIAPGEFVLKNTEVLPGITPPGSYRIKLQFVGEEGEQLACANINFSIIWSASIAETLEGFNPIQLHKKIAKMQAPVAHT